MPRPPTIKQIAGSYQKQILPPKRTKHEPIKSEHRGQEQQKFQRIEQHTFNAFKFIGFDSPKSLVKSSVYSSIYTKGVGINSLLVLRIEAFALPRVVERATAKPTPMYIHAPFFAQELALLVHNKKGDVYEHIPGHLPLRCSRLLLKFAKFQSVENKAPCKRLSINMRFTPCILQIHKRKSNAKVR